MLTKLQKYLIGANLMALITLGIVVHFNKNHIQNLVYATFYSPKKLKVQVDPLELMPGRNHSRDADSYAYDVTEVKAYLTGEKEYTGEKLVFLTIDDGANTDVTPRILDILAEHQVHATFFPIGIYINEENAELYQRQIHEGHAIALHSYYHNLDLLYPYGWPNPDQITTEAQDSHNALKSLLGLKFNTRVWRYPGGHMSWKGLEPVDQALKEQDLEWIDWNANIGDAEPEQRRPTTLEEMLDFHRRSSKNFDDSLKPIQVVLMHDTWGKELTVQALPHVIQYYKDQGFKFGVLY